MTAPVTPTDPAPGADTAAPRYTGEGGALFGLALRTAVLTLLTLGIYRFWAKTRIRRYIWSSVQLDGTRFEYTGTGLEKFLGFLVAVVILAIYLGLVQLLLAFLGLSLFVTPESPGAALAQGVAFSLTGLAVLPLVFFAQYRARRYKCGRTRWRGIRFGMEKAAWGYALRALLYYGLALLTLGLLWPLATWRLSRYMTDRTWFGDARFTLGGRWTGLYPAMTHILVPVALLVGGTAFAILSERPALAAILPPVAAIWLVIGVVHYRVQSFAYLTRHTTLGGTVGFDARPRTGTVIRKYVGGSILIALAIGVVGGLLTSFFGVLFGGLMQMAEAGRPDGAAGAMAFVLPMLAALFGYLAILLFSGAAAYALIVQPILAHYTETLAVSDVAALQDIRQRAADRGADAEGFADALDLGGAI